MTQLLGSLCEGGSQSEMNPWPGCSWEQRLLLFLGEKSLAAQRVGEWTAKQGWVGVGVTDT